MSSKVVSKTAAEIAALLGVETASNTVVSRVSGIDTSGEDAVVFAVDAASLNAALASRAGLILARRDAETSDNRVLKVRDPKYAFAVCGAALSVPENGPLVHPNASIDASAAIGVGTRVGAGAVIEANAVVGAGCSIGSRVTVCAGATLGDRVVVLPGAVLGSTGFGYVRNPETGEYRLFPQQGSLVIEDDVEIGANTTIDRGALGETRIGRGTKIDNQIHIGHNCIIGKNVVIAAQVGISGSCVVGDGVVMAGQVGLGDHVTIGPGVILGGASGVFPMKHLEGPGQLFMGVPAEPIKDYLKSLARVRRLK
jgi:UDP-3-O-[3-hydroxymyristoyl] glucosamine N-acyltransferase